MRFGDHTIYQHALQPQEAGGFGLSAICERQLVEKQFGSLGVSGWKTLYRYLVEQALPQSSY